MRARTITDLDRTLKRDLTGNELMAISEENVGTMALNVADVAKQFEVVENLPDTLQDNRLYYVTSENKVYFSDGVNTQELMLDFYVVEELPEELEANRLYYNKDDGKMYFDNGDGATWLGRQFFESDTLKVEEGEILVKDKVAYIKDSTTELPTPLATNIHTITMTEIDEVNIIGSQPTIATNEDLPEGCCIIIDKIFAHITGVYGINTYTLDRRIPYSANNVKLFVLSSPAGGVEGQLFHLNGALYHYATHPSDSYPETMLFPVSGNESFELEVELVETPGGVEIGPITSKGLLPITGYLEFGVDGERILVRAKKLGTDESFSELLSVLSVTSSDSEMKVGTPYLDGDILTVKVINAVEGTIRIKYNLGVEQWL